jgi:hypothetical protein
MATQVLCDACQKPIDLTEPYYQVTATKVQVENANDPTVPDQPVTVEIAQQFDYHDGHQPETKPKHDKPDQELPEEVPAPGEPTPEPDAPSAEHPIVLPEDEAPVEGGGEDPDPAKEKPPKP